MVLTHKQPNCAPSCFKQTNIYNFGLGVVRSGSWLLQGPLLPGEDSTEAYLPAKKIAIAVVVTFSPGAFDSQGNYPNASDPIFRAIGTYLAPRIRRRSRAEHGFQSGLAESSSSRSVAV